MFSNLMLLASTLFSF